MTTETKTQMLTENSAAVVAAIKLLNDAGFIEWKRGSADDATGTILMDVHEQDNDSGNPVTVLSTYLCDDSEVDIAYWEHHDPDGKVFFDIYQRHVLKAIEEEEAS